MQFIQNNRKQNNIKNGKVFNKFTKSENKSIPHVKEYKKENNDDMNINMNI